MKDILKRQFVWWKLPLVLKNSMLRVLLLGVLSMSFMSADIMASGGNNSQQAMKVAEQQTKGKAVSSKFIQQGEKKGYKVRILKGGKVSHVFISLTQLQ